ncbi:MAG: Maf family nucleotide pyrophosphatase [Propionibacteriaceae bacterium]|jgi:septum formation protein|nr:Maf family nucleotide pyrophosphatase [Propionibacteriaceae bacterium]
MRLILASASPARLQTLLAAGLDPEVVVSEVDEDAISAPTATELVAALAAAKAQAVAATVTGAALVVGCDSMLEFEGAVLGKPGDEETARQYWRNMSGKTGLLHTGHCVISLPAGETAVEVATTLVRFAALSEAEIDAYVATGEPLQVAGGFKIDGFGGAFVTGIEGDSHNVVGLSVPLLRNLVARLGVDYHTLWRHDSL